ncbi:MAG: carboxypeptidase-like regulatory domain-containing protein, partial [Pseudobdellovibrionaceae bacterium]|nr:carboxypeptidase-like regulatory domain-containing protein [Pseudobdellovibrionaceae bacterium]
MSLYKFLAPGFLFLIASCSDSSSGPRGTTATVTGDSVNVAGALVLSSEAAAETTTSNPTATQPVQLTDESGNTVAEGLTDAAGNFSLQIDGGALGLTETGKTINPFEVPRVLKLSSLFLVNSNAKDKAVGIQQSMVLDSKRFVLDSDGKPMMETGVQQARKVGAIVGKIKLETGGDFVGTDIYIPGTSYIAKTDAEGRFVLGFLPAGIYALRAERDGYVSSEWTNITVIKNETTLLDDVTLPIAIGPQIKTFEVGSISESSGEATIKIKLHAATKYRISKRSDFSDTQFKPVDAAKPEFELKFELNAGFKVVQIFLEAADSDGLSANSVLTIDRDPPRLGSIAINAANNVVNTESVPLTLSAEGADKMRFAETYDGLAEATWTAYATSFSYPLHDTTDGLKKVYVTFADNSGNLLGGAGEIFTSFTLDRTAPTDGKILLLQPESPTGAFNTPLAWTADYTDNNISYQVQVSAQSNFSTLLREMTSTTKTLNINPPLDNAGSYHWRVRAVDQAGNRSAWVESSIVNSTSFSVQILAEAYHAKYDAKGTAGRDRMFAKELIQVGDINADGTLDYAYSILQTAFNSSGVSCQDCGVVRIVSGSDWSTLGSVSDGLDKTSGFGHRMITCDVTGDGNDELIVSAPGHAVEYNNAHYYNAGAFYVYRMSDFTRLDRVQADPVISGSVPGYSSCSQWDGITCKAYG